MKIIEQGYILDAEQITGPKRVCIFTSLLRHSSGTIYVSYRWGSSKDSADGNGVVAESADQGRTWQTVCDGFAATQDGVTGEIRSAELFERTDGTLGVLLSWFDRSRGDKLYDSSADTLLPGKTYTAESLDGGRTWENYRVVDTGGFQGAAVTGRVLRVPGRGWLGFFEKYAPEKPGGPNLHAAHAWVST
ncbi:exo-alpha-sialidase, partial [bacterium]|nr:exo-alpha-sialidase [bacterium]